MSFLPEKIQMRDRDTERAQNPLSRFDPIVALNRSCFLDVFLAKGSCHQPLSACLLACDKDEPLLCTNEICWW